MAKVILVSQFPLPFHKIGSWTTMYKNYLESHQHNIDYIVCEKPEGELFHVNYQFVESNFFLRLTKKITKNPYLSYINSILKIMNNDEKYIIQIIDNFGIIPYLQAALVQKNLRSNCYIQFYYHGYSPFVKNIEQSWFFDYVNEFVLLTYKSYLEHKTYYTNLPIKFSVLHNGINTQLFYPLSEEEKHKRRINEGIDKEKIFIWCAQDRPKKGLSIVLEAWSHIEKKYKNVKLWVIGTDKKNDSDTIKYFGKIKNDQLPYYFQLADVFLFSSLCHEGFGMTLIEALHCGAYCIASDNGGIAEVIESGKFGKLILHPNMVDDWIDALEEYLNSPLKFEKIPQHKYSHIEWNQNMNRLIEKSKLSFLL